MALERRLESLEEAGQEHGQRSVGREDSETGERGDQQRAQVMSRSLAAAQFGSGSSTVQRKAAPRAAAGLTPGQVQRAIRRNPHWVSTLGLRPSTFGTSAGPSTAEFAHAVADYQRASGLAVDGIAGPKTHLSSMAGLLEDGSTKAKEIPGVLDDGDVRAAHRAMAARGAAGKPRDGLEPGVLGDKDVLESGLLGGKDTLESGVLSEKDVLEPGVLGGRPEVAGRGAGSSKPGAVLEAGVLGEEDAMESGVLGEADQLEPGLLDTTPGAKRRADELE